MDVCPEQCSICFGEYAPEVVLKCGHVFCKTCIGHHKESCREGWDCGVGEYDNFQTDITAKCPVCRSGDVTEYPIGDRLKAAIQDQVNGNLSIINKSIAFTRAGNAAHWSPVSGETDWSKVTRIKVHR